MRHVSDEQLAMLVDGELRGWAGARVERHLLGCAECSRRRRMFAGAGAEASAVLGGEGYEFRGPWLRTRVRMGMRVAREREEGVRLAWWGRVAVVLPVLAVVAAGMVLRRAEEPGNMAHVKGLAEPDRRLTPGAVRAVGVAMLCSEGGEDFDPELPIPVRQAVFREYGMMDGRAGEYQVDYLVSPQLGGTDAMENLWPEPYGATEWNAHAKDALEVRLRQMVCAGKVDLRTAQEAIREDWIGAYRKYMGADGR